MQYRSDFIVSDFRWNTYNKERVLSLSEERQDALNELICDRFGCSEDWPSEEEINDFVQWDCDNFFAGRDDNEPPEEED